MKSLEKLHETALTRDIRYYLLLHRGYVYSSLYAPGVRDLAEKRRAFLRIIPNPFQFLSDEVIMRA